MKNILFIISGVILTILSSCSSDDDEPSTPSAPTIEVVRNPQEGPYKVGQNIEFAINLRTDPSVGIASFVINKGSVEVFSRTDYTSEGVNFNFVYTSVIDDLTVEEISLTFILTDNNAQRVTVEEKFSVTQEYAYLQDNFRPEPSWDLVENVGVSSEDGANVDVVLVQVSTPGGGSSTFIGKNGTVFYNIGSSVNFFDPNISTEQILNAINGVEPTTELVILNDLVNPSIPNQFPIIAKIRGKEVYAIIDFANQGGAVWGYRKTSEFAGR